MPATADPRSAQQQADEWLDLDEVLGKRAIHTRLWPTIVMHEEQSAAAPEVMSRFAVDPPVAHLFAADDVTAGP